MRRRQFVRSLAWSVGPWIVKSRSAPPPLPVHDRPNVILIVADDLGYADLSGFGRRDYRTPNLDRLGAEGVRLTQAYSAAPVCSPTRVGLMTGRYPARFEVGLLEPLSGHPIGLEPGQSVLARGFKSRGYSTGLVGKWHLGVTPQYHPLRHGFDQFYGFLGHSLDYASHRNGKQEPDFYEGEKPIEADGYLTDLFAQRAVRFIEESRSSPFFLSLQFNAPHWPWQAPGDPPYPDSLAWTKGGSPAVFGRMVERMDSGVGELVRKLELLRLDRRTLVIFTSDNGGEQYSDMGPLRDKKFSLWEGGIRVAALVRWPGVVPADRTSEQAVISMDWTRTALGAAGAGPEWTGSLDGIDLMPMLRGQARPVARRLYWRTLLQTKHRALRQGWWKYLRTETGENLFDLKDDAGETTNLAEKEPRRLGAMRATYAAWDRQMVDPARIPKMPNN